MTDQERLILLNLIPDIGSNRLRKLLDAFGSLSAVFSASRVDFEQVNGIGPKTAAALAAGLRQHALLERELTLAKREGVRLVTFVEADYPAFLKTIHDPPLVLYVKGRLPEADAATIAIVGTRAASHYGLQVAQRLAYDLALRGVTVVSGMAKGIDGAAHRGALKAQGATLAILGSGLCRIYPAEHKALADQIAQKGALISECPMGMAPLAHNFPRRNRIISGLSRGVVVVEAAQKSGAIITADQALEQGREVFAVPGPIHAVSSLGTHKLLKQGARLVTSVEDILEELGWDHQAGSIGVSERPPQQTAPESPVSEAASRVLAVLEERRPLDMDQLSTATGMTIPELSTQLLHLELARRIRQLPGKLFIRL